MLLRNMRRNSGFSDQVYWSSQQCPGSFLRNKFSRSTSNSEGMQPSAVLAHQASHEIFWVRAHELGLHHRMVLGKRSRFNIPWLCAASFMIFLRWLPCRKLGCELAGIWLSKGEWLWVVKFSQIDQIMEQHCLEPPAQWVELKDQHQWGDVTLGGSSNPTSTSLFETKALLWNGFIIEVVKVKEKGLTYRSWATYSTNFMTRWGCPTSLCWIDWQAISASSCQQQLKREWERLKIWYCRHNIVWFSFDHVAKPPPPSRVSCNLRTSGEWMWPLAVE